MALPTVSAALERAGVVPTGWAWVADKADVGTRFEYVTDLNLTTERLTEESVPYRLGAESAVLGDVALTFDRAEPGGRHPVLLLTYAGPYAIPQHMWSKADRSRSKRFREAVRHLARLLCEEVDPAYAVVDIEEPVPTPEALAAGNAQLGGDAYVSGRMLDRLGGLSDTLDAAFSECAVEQWRSGSFYSCWLLDGSTGEPDNDRLRNASARIGRLLAHEH